jgi:hypothetical protein
MKTTTLLFAIIFTFISTNSLFAQGGWQRIYPMFSGGPFGDGVDAVRQTLDGGYVMAGLSDHNSGASNNRVVKVDFQGNIQWSNSYSSLNNYSWATNIELAPGGGFYVEGKRTNPVTFKNEVYLQRIDANGNEVWVNFYPQATHGNKGSVTSDGGYISCNYDYDNISFQDSVALIKTAADGTFEWSRKYPNSIGLPHSVIHLSTGEYLLEGFKNNKLFLRKFSATGDTLWQAIYGTQAAHPEYIGKVIENNDGTFTLIGNDALTFGAHDMYLLKTNANGQVIWEKHFNQTAAFGSDLAPTSDGGYILTGFRNYATTPGVVLIKVDNEGNQQWIKHYNGNGVGQWKAYSVRQTQDGGYIVGGAKVSSFYTRQNMYLIKTDELGEIYSNTLQGYVHIDADENCIMDGGEQGLGNWLVEVSGAQDFWTTTDVNGFYWVRVDLGDYDVIVHPAPNSNYWTTSACAEDTIAVSVVSEYSTFNNDFPKTAAAYCPLLTVSMSTPFLRRCFVNNYVVNYCNSGTEDATNGFVVVEFDSYLNVVVADLSVPYTALGNNTFQFDIGLVSVGQCGSFTVPVYVSCDAFLGQVHCSNAEIFPQTACLLPDWTGPVINASGICSAESVVFTLYNSGSAMPDPRTYTVIIDDFSFETSTFQLGAEESEAIEIPFVNASSYRIEAQQAIGYPSHLGDSIAMISLQECDNPSPSAINVILPNYDGSPFVDIDCQQNIGAYDPNDKIGFPIGYGDEHFISQNVELEYRIRFQNTGTDTAFTVIIWDTLSPLLDVTSIRPGAASHSYSWRIFGENATVIEFAFPNILLPDSTTNEPASNGFVFFKIAQRVDNPIGSVIENTAAIYFDFNEPIFTNTSQHTIGTNFITVSLLGLTNQSDDLTGKFNVYPNPFHEQVTFELLGYDVKVDPIHLSLYDLKGQLVEELTSNEQSFVIQRKSLKSGIYFFTIKQDDETIEQGKLIVH